MTKVKYKHKGDMALLKVISPFLIVNIIKSVYLFHLVPTVHSFDHASTLSFWLH